jgi:crotonobetainyl-CoA:carnitine CoA-transferase CaiB-like acyl-CoA transferase
MALPPGTPPDLPSRLPVEDTAVAAVSRALAAAAALHAARGGRPGRPSVSRPHVVAAVRSERLFTRAGAPAASSFAPLSRFWRTADGWVRTHGNYPWHRDALLRALDVPVAADGGDPVAGVERAMAAWRAVDVEDAVVAAGGVAGAVRTPAEWAAHPQGAAVAAEPLVAHAVVDPGAAPARTPAPVPPGAGAAAGLRVLDLTRVIAGPVCTRYLGALGADVLRIDPPQRPDGVPGAPADTLLGKRSAVLDLRAPDGRRRLDELVDRADVVVSGYRPGALDRFGIAPEALAERRPGVVVVVLSAWGHGGPWAGRRGFDSVVQAPTGLAVLEAGGDPDAAPGALPCQLLDHGTGYLAAAAALDGLRRRAEEGGTHVHRLSLARTAAWLAAGDPGPPATDVASDASPWRVRVGGPGGGSPEVTAVRPPGRLAGRPLDWPRPPAGYGDAAPAWLDEPPTGSPPGRR